MKNFNGSMLDTSRENWIDFAKGIAIILVMWGHVYTVQDRLFNWITAWHVAVFLILTGYLFEGQKKTDMSFRNTENKIIKPYVIFSIFAVILDSLVIYWQTGSAISVIKRMVLEVYKTVIFYGIHALWYLSSYIIAVFIFLKLKKIRYSYLLFLLFSVIGVGFSILAQKLNMVFNGSIVMAMELLVASIVRGFVCSSFLMMGAALFQAYRKFGLLNQYGTICGGHY